HQGGFLEVPLCLVPSLVGCLAVELDIAVDQRHDSPEMAECGGFLKELQGSFVCVRLLM
ncbi:hypothetical protein A2U01_0087563, partial [Trifolium medium]|nr:hypothetical protein [Trifolium medium]